MRTLGWLFGAKKMVKDFEEKFPGKCMICSYHRFGVSHGYVSGEVRLHDCPEVAERVLKRVEKLLSEPPATEEPKHE